MKHFLFFAACVCMSIATFAQNKTETDNRPEFVKVGTIPEFTVYTAPDSTAFTKSDLHKNRPTVIMVFSPECGHCQNVTKEIVDNIQHFKNAQILMVTWLPYSEMLNFYHTFHIAEYPQITMAWDRKDFFLPYYHVQMYPGVEVYNKKGKYVRSFNGEINVAELYKSLDEK